jgi:DNA-binding LacI/PurR family transcriptional regulator
MARRPSQDVNLAAVAQRLNIAISTVSRAMRNAEGVHSTTRARVLEAAKSMGYDFSRRNAPEVSAQPHYIMAMAQCSAPQSDQRYLTGMSRASVTLNLAILSHHATVEECSSVLDSRYQPAALKSGLVEGLVLIHHWPREVAAELGKKWPTVSIIHHYPDTNIDHVGIDDRAGMAVLIAHLRAGGHTRIGFFGLCREMSWACSRFSAYVESLMRLGLTYEPSNVVEISLAEALTPTPFDCTEYASGVIGRKKAGVDAWVCSSSASGYSLCRGLLSRGLRIPQDISVAGYHQSRTQPPDLPAMTSTDVADEELGAAALRRLIHRFNHPDETQRSVLLPARFIQGETTRKVAGPANR